MKGPYALSDGSMYVFVILVSLMANQQIAYMRICNICMWCNLQTCLFLFFFLLLFTDTPFSKLFYVIDRSAHSLFIPGKSSRCGSINTNWYLALSLSLSHLVNMWRNWFTLCNLQKEFSKHLVNEPNILFRYLPKKKFFR